MFRNRNSSQKPDDELIRKFQRTFSDVVPVASHHDTSPFGQMANQPVTHARVSMDSANLKLNHDQIPRPVQDLRFNPSFVDPTSLSFMNVPNQPNGYCAPNTGGLGAVFHSQAGDLHTPDMNMLTSFSLPQQISGAPMNTGNPAFGLEHFDQQPFIPPHFHNPFAQQTSYPSSGFLHRDSGYEGMEESAEEPPLSNIDIQGNQSSQFVAPTTQHSDRLDAQEPGENFRYHVTLRTPTAMIKHQKEIPISYLNKGQAYSVSVVDTDPPPMNGQPVKYRTFIRISFEEEEQRSKPSACWQLWKEGRGSNEAHQRGGKLQAVEYVSPIQGGIEDQKQQQMQLESSSFDGFCVIWTANPTTGASECAISVRFNFLSTDFSHSKGVKGIPVRLCAKTEIISPNSVESGADSDAEVCYCKVKLFRDHGAERKLSNDVTHVKKMIEKLRHQIAQAEMGAGNYGKRKRASNSMSTKNPDHRPPKTMKHRRTWSTGSQDDERMTLEDDLHTKLVMMQDMFTSTRSVSILGLRGDDEDDPDLFPVQLPGEAYDHIKKEGCQKFRDSRRSLDASAFQSLSPKSSNISLNSPCPPINLQPGLYYDSGYHGSLNTSRENSRPCSEFSGDRAVLKHPTRVQKISSLDATTPTGYIEAVDIDPTYRPPAERPSRPVACFYIRFSQDDGHRDDYYRAVYLAERTVRDLMKKISQKQQIDPRRIVRVLHIKQNGLKIMIDDDVVRELPDGQDIIVEISEATDFDTTGVANADLLSPPIEVKLSY